MKFLLCEIKTDPPLTRSERNFFRVAILCLWLFVFNVGLFFVNNAIELLRS